MKKKWEPKSVIHDFSTIPTEEYKQILEEFAELIYRDFCQLHTDQPHVNATFTPVEERTNTNG